MDKKETLFWKAIKKESQSLGIYWHRIENIANSGTPDLLATHNSIGYFTLELKITSNNKVNISPFQIAYNKMAYNNGAKAFYLVKTLEPRTLKLYEGNKGEKLAKLGHEKVKPLLIAENFKKIFSLLLVA